MKYNEEHFQNKEEEEHKRFFVGRVIGRKSMSENHRHAHKKGRGSGLGSPNDSGERQI